MSWPADWAATLKATGWYPASRREIARLLLPLGVAIALMVVVTLYQEQLVALAVYGYLGIFLSCAAANSTVFMPAPSSAIVMAMAHVLTPFWVAIAGGTGAAVGECVGYLAGLSGRRIVDQSQRGQQVRKWMTRYGDITVLVLAFLPLPLFDLVGVAAGAMRMRFMRFFGLVLTGKVLKMLIYAYIGVGLLSILEPYIRRLFGS